MRSYGVDAGAVALGGFFALILGAQQPDPWERLRTFEGKWEGTATGQRGRGVSKREYRFDLNGRFLTARNRSVYEPKTPDAKPEVHEDFGVFSFDRKARKLVLRQFHTEGFVNEYAADLPAPNAKTVEFVTVRIENIPAGWRAKESYRIVSRDEMIETFSLAEPGKDFETYSETRLKRVE